MEPVLYSNQTSLLWTGIMAYFQQVYKPHMRASSNFLSQKLLLSFKIIVYFQRLWNFIDFPWFFPPLLSLGCHLRQFSSTSFPTKMTKNKYGFHISDSSSMISSRIVLTFQFFSSHIFYYIFQLSLVWFHFCFIMSRWLYFLSSSLKSE